MLLLFQCLLHLSELIVPPTCDVVAFLLCFGLKLLVDDLPLGIHNLLEVFGVFETDLSRVFFGLERELQVEAQDFGVLKGLGLLFETSVGECLSEANTLDQERVGHRAASDFLDADVVLVQVFAEVHHSVDNNF